MVSGRLAARDAPDEVMLNEPTAEALGVGPGHEVWLETGQAAEGAHHGGTLFPSTVVGIVRTVADLLPVEAESLGAPPIHARDGWSRAHADTLSPDQTLVLVWLDDGDTEGFDSRLQAALGSQAVAVSPALDQGERSNLEQATALESRAALALAAFAAVAVGFLVSQAGSRQGRAESSNVPTLLALGMIRRQLAAAATARWLPAALGGATIALAATLGASLLGPIGLALRAE